MNQFISRLIAKSNGDEAALQPRSVGRFEFQPPPTFREEVEPPFDVLQPAREDLRQRTTPRPLSNQSALNDTQPADSPVFESRPSRKSDIPKKTDIPFPQSRVSTSNSDTLSRQESEERVEHTEPRHAEIIPSLQDSTAKITRHLPPEKDAIKPLTMDSKSISEPDSVPIPDRTPHQAAFQAQDAGPSHPVGGAVHPIGQRNAGPFSEVTPRESALRDQAGMMHMEHELKPALKVDIPEHSDIVESSFNPVPEIPPRRTSPESSEDVRMNVIYPRELDRRAHEEEYRVRQEDPPAIHISIGRIEVRAVQPQPAVRDKNIEKRAPRLSLDDYLIQQREGRR